jgi:hypothetical protein
MTAIEAIETCSEVENSAKLLTENRKTQHQQLEVERSGQSSTFLDTYSIPEGCNG